MIPVDELLDLERVKASDPDYFPMRPPSQRIDEYWAYWTPARLTAWREGAGIEH